MEDLIRSSNRTGQTISTRIIRYLYHRIDWTWRLNAILGARGTGKTTLLIQRLKLYHKMADEAIYISLDDFYFTQHRLYDFVVQFRQKGGKYLFIDEVHKYPGWARDLKNIYDNYPDIYITFTGSSIIDLLKQDVDLSRRAVFYHLKGLSYREYLIFTNTFKHNPIPLQDIIKNHKKIALEISSQIRPLAKFDDYLEHGYYPYFIENINVFQSRLNQTLHLILETDINFIDGYDPRNVRKIMKLLYILANNVPFTPNISKLSQNIGLARNTLVNYIHYLEKAEVIHGLYVQGRGVSSLQKPDKVYLSNTNISYILSQEKPNIGTLRETFVMQHLQNIHEINLPSVGDFVIDDKYIFEIGGKNKRQKQIDGIRNAYIIMDDIEAGSFNTIPLWLLGFIY